MYVCALLETELVDEAFFPSSPNLPLEMLTKRGVPVEQKANGKESDETWPLNIQPLIITSCEVR